MSDQGISLNLNEFINESRPADFSSILGSYDDSPFESLYSPLDTPPSQERPVENEPFYKLENRNVAPEQSDDAPEWSPLTAQSNASPNVRTSVNIGQTPNSDKKNTHAAHTLTEPGDQPAQGRITKDSNATLSNPVQDTPVASQSLPTAQPKPVSKDDATPEIKSEPNHSSKRPLVSQTLTSQFNSGNAASVSNPLAQYINYGPSSTANTHTGSQVLLPQLQSSQNAHAAGDITQATNFNGTQIFNRQLELSDKDNGAQNINGEPAPVERREATATENVAGPAQLLASNSSQARQVPYGQINTQAAGPIANYLNEALAPGLASGLHATKNIYRAQNPALNPASSSLWTTSYPRPGIELNLNLDASAAPPDPLSNAQSQSSVRPDNDIQDLLELGKPFDLIQETRKTGRRRENVKAAQGKGLTQDRASAKTKPSSASQGTPAPRRRPRARKVTKEKSAFVSTQRPPLPPSNKNTPRRRRVARSNAVLSAQVKTPLRPYQVQQPSSSAASYNGSRGLNFINNVAPPTAYQTPPSHQLHLGGVNNNPNLSVRGASSNLESQQARAQLATLPPSYRQNAFHAGGILGALQNEPPLPSLPHQAAPLPLHPHPSPLSFHPPQAPPQSLQPPQAPPLSLQAPQVLPRNGVAFNGSQYLSQQQMLPQTYLGSSLTIPQDAAALTSSLQAAALGRIGNPSISSFNASMVQGPIPQNSAPSPNMKLPQSRGNFGSGPIQQKPGNTSDYLLQLAGGNNGWQPGLNPSSHISQVVDVNAVDPTSMMGIQDNPGSFLVPDLAFEKESRPPILINVDDNSVVNFGRPATIPPVIDDPTNGNHPGMQGRSVITEQGIQQPHEPLQHCPHNNGTRQMSLTPQHLQVIPSGPAVNGHVDGGAAHVAAVAREHRRRTRQKRSRQQRDYRRGAQIGGAQAQADQIEAAMMPPPPKRQRVAFNQMNGYVNTQFTEEDLITPQRLHAPIASPNPTLSMAPTDGFGQQQLAASRPRSSQSRRSRYQSQSPAQFPSPATTEMPRHMVDIDSLLQAAAARNNRLWGNTKKRSAERQNPADERAGKRLRTESGYQNQPATDPNSSGTATGASSQAVAGPSAPSSSAPPSSSSSPPSPSSAPPSRFCHLCTRAAKPHLILICGNILAGSCRKVGCFKCLRELPSDWEALAAPTPWTCTHCRKVSFTLF